VFRWLLVLGEGVWVPGVAVGLCGGFRGKSGGAGCLFCCVVLVGVFVFVGGLGCEFFVLLGMGLLVWVLVVGVLVGVVFCWRFFVWF